MWGLNIFQWLLVLLYLLLSYYTFKKFVAENNKTNKEFLYYLFIKFPALIFVIRNYEEIVVSSKVLMLIIAYCNLFIYYVILLKNYYKDRNKK